MSSFGEDLIQSLTEAVTHVEGDGPALVHEPVNAAEIRQQVNLTQTQMAFLMGMSLSDYRSEKARPIGQ